MRLARVLLPLCVLLFAAPASARSKPSRPAAPATQTGEQFTPHATTELLDQPQGGRSVARLQAGQGYRFLKTGGPGGAWCKVDANGQQGWVQCSAGGRGAGNGTRPSAEEAEPTRNTARTATGCATSCTRAPLFASALALTPADREVLALCPARPDVSVSAADVRRFLSAHYDDPRIQRALSAAGRPGSGRGVKEGNVEWLTGLWVSTGPRNAFTHSLTLLPPRPASRA